MKRVRGRSTSGGRGGGEPPPGPADPVPYRPASTPVGLVTGLASKSKYFLKKTRFFKSEKTREFFSCVVCHRCSFENYICFVTFYNGGIICVIICCECCNLVFCISK